MCVLLHVSINLVVPSSGISREKVIWYISVRFVNMTPFSEPRDLSGDFTLNKTELSSDRLLPKLENTYFCGVTCLLIFVLNLTENKIQFPLQKLILEKSFIISRNFNLLSFHNN